MKILHYLNLTNGLEFEDIPDARFVRIPSTSIEQNDWFSIFAELDHDIVTNLAIGNHCIVYDCGCRRQTSKTISVGVPTIKSHLEALWYGKTKPTNYLFEYTPGCNLDHLTRLKRKYEYYRRYLNGGSVNLFGVSKATTNDGNREYYRHLLISRNTNSIGVTSETFEIEGIKVHIG